MHQLKHQGRVALVERTDQNVDGKDREESCTTQMTMISCQIPADRSYTLAAWKRINRKLLLK